MAADLRLVSTCPESSTIARDEYPAAIRETARWCEEAGHDGLLIHAGNHLEDPWVLAQLVLAEVEHLRPVVTLQPCSLHPYAAARKLATLATLFGRAPDIVLAAGGSREDLLALGDHASHDARYRRLVEYGRILQNLVASEEPLEFDGEFYRLHRPSATTVVPEEARPRYFVAGSSAAGRAAADSLGAIPVAPFDPEAEGYTAGVRVGVITRPDARTAERDAEARFPEVPARRVEHRLGMALSDSDWQQRLDRLAERIGGSEPLWMHPYEHGYAHVPYLVGDYRGVARELLGAFASGTRWLFLGAPSGPEDLGHLGQVVRRAWRRAVTPLALTG